MELEVLVTLGLGDNSFVIASGDEAALVDPQRDAWRFLEAAERQVKVRSPRAHEGRRSAARARRAPARRVEQRRRSTGSIQIFVGDLPGRLDTLPHDRELWVLCTNGHWAAIGASLLDGRDVPVRLVAKSGILGLMEHVGPFTLTDAPC